MAEYDATDNEQASYGYRPDSTWTTDPLWQKRDGEYYFYQNDHLGTPQKLVKQNGAVVWSASYTAFGQATLEIQVITNNLRFPGQYADAETGLHYNNQRYYDPRIGRYRNADPIGFAGGNNFYTYTLNPLRFIDSLGLQSESTGVKMCFRIIYGEATSESLPTWGSVWHLYLQIGSSWEYDWTRGFDGAIYPETRDKEKHRNDARFCNDLKKKRTGTLPNGTSCECASPEQIQRCIKNANNFPQGTYHEVWRNCGDWAALLAEKCCLKPNFNANRGFPYIGGGRLWYGPTKGWDDPKSGSW